MTHAVRARRTLSRLAAGGADRGPAARERVHRHRPRTADGGGVGDGTSDGSATTAPTDGEQDPRSMSSGPPPPRIWTPTPPTDPGYAEYYEQEIEWDACEDVQAPRTSSAAPSPSRWSGTIRGHGDIEIAVGRMPGQRREDRIAVSPTPAAPAGPGSTSSRARPFMISPEVRAAYDVVGFDPRGVNRSAGVECLSDEETDEYLAATAEPGSEESAQLYEEWGARIAEACEANSSEVLPYLDTYSCRS